MNEQILYNRPMPGARLDMAHPLTKGLVGCWMLNDKGMRAMDLSPYARHGVMTGFSPMQQAHNGLRFNAAPYITIGDYSDFSVVQTGQMTVEAWFSTTLSAQTVTGADIVSKHNSAGDREWALYESGGAATTFRAYTVAGTQILALSSASSAPGVVCQAVVTVNSGVISRLYIDGQQRASSTTFSAAFGDGATPLSIGNTGLVAPMDGVEYLVRIWNRALNAAEVTQLHQTPYAMVLE